MEVYIVQVTNSKGVVVQQSNAYRSLAAAQEVAKAYSTEWEVDYHTYIVSFEVV